VSAASSSQLFTAHTYPQILHSCDGLLCWSLVSSVRCWFFSLKTNLYNYFRNTIFG